MGITTRAVHPLARDLLWGFDANYGPNDFVGGVTGTPSGSSPPAVASSSDATAPTPYQYNINGNTTTNRSYIAYSSDARTANLARRPTTWAFLLKFNLLSGSVVSGGLMQRNDGNTISAGWGIQLVTSAGLLQPELTFERSISNTVVRGPGMAASVWHTLVLTTNGSGRADSVCIYQNGVPNFATVTAPGSGVQGDDSSRTLELGRSIYIGSGWSTLASVGIALISGREWTQQDVDLFSALSYSIWSRPRRLPSAFTPVTFIPWRWFLQG